MATIDRTLQARMMREPDQEFSVIVRTDREVREVVEQCVHHGIIVHHQFRLVPGLALTATGEALLELAENPHVTRIEPDQEVRGLEG
jgi:hypothetical protein